MHIFYIKISAFKLGPSVFTNETYKRECLYIIKNCFNN